LASSGPAPEVVPALPDGYAIRPVDPDRDLPRVSALFLACDLADVGAPDHQDDWIVEAWRSSAVKGAWVVERGDETVAFVELESYDTSVAFDAFIPTRPDHRPTPLRRTLLAFAEAQAARLTTAPEVAFRASASAADGSFEGDAEALGLSYVRTFWHMERPLDPSEPAGDLPAGVTVRPSRDPEDDEAVYRILDEAFRGHFGIEPMTLDEWRADFKDGLYDPALVLIAEADGEPAGVAANWLPSGMGWVGDLAVLERHRGRGIGGALLRHSFALLAARGATEVRLNVDADNGTGATRLYASVGMTERRRFHVHEKRLRAAG
jgi:mycothiol synthase